MSRQPIGLLVVDEQELVREGVRAGLRADPRFAIRAEAGTGAEALARVRRGDVEVVVCGLRLPDMAGVELCRSLRSRVPALAVVLHACDVSEETLRAAISAGAAACVAKAEGLAALRDAVWSVGTGAGVAPIHAQLHRLLVEPVGRERLTAREEHLLVMVADGLTYREIAARLFVSESTVRLYMDRLRTAFGARNNPNLIAKAVGSGAMLRPAGAVRRDGGAVERPPRVAHGVGA